MILSDETGLPEVPEGHYWEVVEVNWPLPGTLRMELHVEKEVTKTKTVFDELPKKWYQFSPDVKERTVEYTVPVSECVDWEALVDEHVHFFNNESTEPVGPGWEPERNHVQPTMFWGGPHPVPMYTTSEVNVSADSIYLKYYRRHPSTPESVRAAAERIFRRVEKKLEKETALLQEKEVRANLIGKYPPKTLKG